LRLLLDSHAALWWVVGSARLSSEAQRLISEARNVVFLSAVACYELHSKASRRLLEIESATLARALDSCGFAWLPVTPAHATTAATLRWRHRDPWDRLLAAQASIEQCALVSRDAVFDALPIERVW
jgi:PIN domain nuclease of toxin-antitoxin system